MARARWVETRRGDLAILIKIVESAALIRWAEDWGGYAWTGVADLRRRPDLDNRREPAWLQKARASRRPDAALWWLLDRVPAPPDDLDPTPQPKDGPPDPMFDTDADGRVLDFRRIRP
jgi:hypothetical protein